MYESDYESIIMSSIIESKTLKNSTDLSTWRSKYMNKVKIAQQEYVSHTNIDEDSIIESYRPNCFDLETWFNTFDSVLGVIEINFAEFLKRLYSFNFSLKGDKTTHKYSSADIRLVELKED
jgi:hypothetical protein